MKLNFKLPSNQLLKGDFWGGLSAMLVALPSAIAFGVTIYAPLGGGFSAIGAVGGIVGVAIIGLVASFLGGAKRLISAPCAPAAAVLSGFSIASIQNGIDPNAVVVMLTLIMMLAGVIQIGFGAIGLGKLIKYMPYTVVSGYLTGVGLYIISSQTPKFLGMPKGYHFFDSLQNYELWMWQSIVVGLSTIAFMIFAPKITTKIPAVIIALCGGAATYFALGLIDPSLLQIVSNPFIVGPIGDASIIQSIKEHLSKFSNVSFADVVAVVAPALTLAVLLSIDTLKTCVVLDAMTKSQHDSNKELIAQGSANICSCAIGGIAGAGQMGATLVNISSGAQTKFSGIFEGLLGLFAFIALGSFIAWIPVSALGAILMVIGFRMIDRHSFDLIKSKDTILDFAVIAAVVITALSVSLIAASGVGIALAILLFVKEQTKTSVVHRKTKGGHIFSKQIRTEEEFEIIKSNGNKYSIYELQGSLFFGTANQLLNALSEDLKNKQYIILDMKRTQFVDFTAAHILEQVIDIMEQKKGHLVFSQVPLKLPSGQDVSKYFGELGLVSEHEKSKVFDNLDSALCFVEDKILKENHFEKDEEEMLDLEEFELFYGRKEKTIIDIKQHIQEVFYPKGTVIFAHKSTTSDLFLIRKGKVKIVLPLENGQNLHISSFGRGSFFGEFSFLDDAPRSADAVADTDVNLFVLSRTDFDSFASEHKKSALLFIESLSRALAWRLRNTNIQLGSLSE